MNDSPTPRLDDMSGGLRAAFGAGDPDGPGGPDGPDGPDGPAGPSGDGGAGQPSVLRLLQEKTGSRMGLHLHAAEKSADPPVRIDEEGRALRDPTGRYEVLGEIGRGGVGVVYKGRDQDLGRDVAMKVLRQEYVDRPDILARFVEEAQIGGQLQHPGIVPVYELGLQHGERPYFAMKLVKGETLAALLARRTDPAEDRRKYLGIFEQVCQTLAYAHARRVVHRDLKPANVMLGSFGEVQVVDWGFAKVLPEGEQVGEATRGRAAMAASVISTVRSDPRQGAHSVVGSLLGTPAYMPPEQALGDVEHMDRRSDVFGLGAILCEILTGQPPYLEQDGDVVQQAARADLQGACARIERSGADPALAALCKQCLSPARQARPESAKQVAEAISLYLSSVEERARQAQIRAAEAKVRARATVLLSAAAVLLLALGGGGYLYMEQQAQARRAQAGERAAAALNEANVRLGEARAAGVADLSRWARALDAATQAAHLADDADVDEEQRARVRARLAAVQQEQERARAEAARIAKDVAMRQRLLEARIPTDDDVGSKGYWLREVKRRNDAYAAAFLAYLDGRDLTAMTVEDGVAALAGPLAVELATALDHWVLGRRYLINRNDADAPDVEATARLREMAKGLDRDPWRNQLRTALDQQHRDRETLLRLQTEADLGSLPAVSVQQLATALWNLDVRDEACTVYRAACERFPDDFLCIFQLGRLHEEAKRWREAVSCFQIARALRPDMREVKHRLGLCLISLRDYASAERCFQDLARQEPFKAHWQLHLGDLREYQHQWPEAELCYRRALELDPQYAVAHERLGHVLIQQERFVEGSIHVQRAIELDPTSAGAHIELGITLAEQGHLEQARDSFHRALALDKGLASAAYANLGNVYYKWNDLEKAIACHEHAIRLDPGYAGAYNNLANAFLEQRRFGDAIDAYRRALELDPKVARFHLNLGVALQARDGPTEAIASYRQAIALGGNDASAHYLLGWALQLAERFDKGIARVSRKSVDEVIACYRRAIALDPRHAMAHHSLGLVFAALGESEKAIASYQQAIALDPKLALARANLGLSFASQGKLDEAIASYRQAIAVDPKLAMVHYYLGLALAARGEPEKAIASYRRAIALDAKLAAAHYNVGLALATQHKLDEAITSYEEAIALDPENANARHVRGNALANQRRFDEAITSYQEAIALDPKLAAAHGGLGVAFARQGRLDEAIASLQTAVALDPKLAQGHHSLGLAFEAQGRLVEALESQRRAAAILAETDDARFRELRQRVTEAIDRAIERMPKLLALARGELAAERADDIVDAAMLVYRRGEYALSASTYGRALASFPELLPVYPHRYNAACAAALAGVGKGEDAGSLSDAERARLRQQARTWLAAEAARWAQDLAVGGAKAKEARRQLAQAQRDPDFAGERGDEALAQLPAAEAGGWRRLWQQIAGLLEEPGERK